MAPQNPVDGRQLDVTASGNAYDANAVVDATLKATGGACGPAPPPLDSATPTNNSDIPVVGRTPYSITVISQQTFDACSYLVCAWLVDRPPLDSPPRRSSSVG